LAEAMSAFFYVYEVRNILEKLENIQNSEEKGKYAESL